MRSVTVKAAELGTTSQEHPIPDGDTPGPESAGTVPIRAFILLAGSVRKTGFLTAIGRSVLDLPLKQDLTLGQHWVNKAEELAETISEEMLPFRVVVDGDTPEPALPVSSDRLQLEIEADPFEFRGTAGVLRDLTREYHEDDYILIANASQPPLGSLESDFAALAGARGVGRVLIDGNRSPTGLILLRTGCLDAVPDVGYTDLKEQALPEIAEEEWVSAVVAGGKFLEPIRDRATYLAAVHAFHVGPEALDDPFRENWQSTFSLVEEGAEVAATARVRDSVVLRGGTVGENSVAARSVVCPGRTVRDGGVLVGEPKEEGRTEDR